MFQPKPWQAAACAGQSGPCRLQLQPLNISWTTVTEPAMAASLAAVLAADQLQTRQTLLSGYFFPTASLPRWFDQPIQSVLFAAIIHTEASVSSAAQLGHCCSSFFCCCSETLQLSSTELLNCSIRYLRFVSRHFSLIRHNRTVARASVLWRDINWLSDWLAVHGTTHRPKTLRFQRTNLTQCNIKQSLT